MVGKRQNSNDGLSLKSSAMSNSFSITKIKKRGNFEQLCEVLRKQLKENSFVKTIGFEKTKQNDSMDFF